MLYIVHGLVALNVTIGEEECFNFEKSGLFPTRVLDEKNNQLAILRLHDDLKHMFKGYLYYFLKLILFEF